MSQNDNQESSLLAEKKKSNRLILFLLVIVLIAVSGYFIRERAWLSQDDQVIYIAVMRAQTGKDCADGIDTLRGIQLYLNEINHQVNGKRIEILDFNDRSLTNMAVEKAVEMLNGDKQPLLVIGHAQSGSSIAAGEIYENHGIPAISGSATADELTEDNEWYFRVIPNSYAQSTFLANYMWHINGNKSVVVIHDDDAFGFSMAEPFIATFEALGGEIKCVHDFDNKSATLQADLEAIANETCLTDESEVSVEDELPEAIYLATHAPEGVQLVVAIKNRGLEADFYGSSAFTNVNFIEGFLKYREENLSPGYYSNGVYGVAPIVFDVAGVVGQDFRNTFVREYGEEPGMKAATNYDAIKVAVHAIENADISGLQSEVTEDRLKIRDYLQHMTSPPQAVNGATGNIYFDDYGNVVKMLSMAIYEQQQRISAMTQLHPITDIEQLADFETALAEGRILEVGDQYMYKTDVVYTGLDLVEITNLDEDSATFLADFYIWFRYKGDVDADNIKFINATEDISLGEPIADHQIGDIRYKAYRVRGEFSGNFEFRDYPFDKQELAIKFRHQSYTREKLIYVVDFVGMELSADREAVDRVKETAGGNQVLNIGSWLPVKLNFFQNITVSNSTLGNPKVFGFDSSIEYSRFNAVLHIKRNVVSFWIKNLIPLFAVTILAYISVLLPLDQFAIKNAIDRGALLTVAFFHIKLSNDLPGVGYTIALDYVFYTMYTIIVFNLIMSVIIRNAYQKEKHNRARRLSMINKVVYPIVILSVELFLMYHYEVVDFPLL